MRLVLIALLTSGLLGLSAAPARAQSNADPCAGVSAESTVPCVPIPLDPSLLERFTQPDPCNAYAAQAAMPSLAQAYGFSPDGYGPYGWGPLTQPLGAGPIGPATFYSPPGVVPAYGPFGPGQTAYAIAAANVPASTFVPGSIPIQNFQNTLTQLGLAGLQQAELGTLYARYGIAATDQTAAALYVNGYSAQARATLNILRGYCHGLQQPNPPVPADATR